jgi:hypothetical protein
MRRLWLAALLCLVATISSGTVTSPDDLDNNYFQDSQPAGSITPSRVRVFNDSASGLFITQQAGTAYTFVLTDRGTMVESTSASATTFTVPTNATTAFDIGAMVCFREYGTGTLTIAAASGVTIDTPSSLIIRARYASGCVHKRATNEWVLSGDMQ